MDSTELPKDLLEAVLDIDDQIKELTEAKKRENIKWLNKKSKLRLDGKTKEEIETEKNNSGFGRVLKELKALKSRKRYYLGGSKKKTYTNYPVESKSS